MKNISSRKLILAGCALGLIFLTGCYFYSPDGNSEIRAIYAKTDQNRKTNEVIIVVGIISGTGYPFTPEGPQPRTSHYKRRYYFTGGHLRRKALPFLAKTDADHGWITSEVFAPIADTNSWIRVETPDTGFNEITNVLVLTVFNPQKLLYQQKVTTVDVPKLKFVYFEDGNRILNYKSEHDAFTYDVTQNVFVSHK